MYKNDGINDLRPVDRSTRDSHIGRSPDPEKRPEVAERLDEASPQGIGEAARGPSSLLALPHGDGSSSSIPQRTTRQWLWTMHFWASTLASGRSVHVLGVIRSNSDLNECLALNAYTALNGAQVMKVLAKLILKHGAPRSIISEYSEYFSSGLVLELLALHDVVFQIAPFWPADKGRFEEFHRKLHRECLSTVRFETLGKLRSGLSAWRKLYNERALRALPEITANDALAAGTNITPNTDSESYSRLVGPSGMGKSNFARDWLHRSDGVATGTDYVPFMRVRDVRSCRLSKTLRPSELQSRQGSKKGGKQPTAFQRKDSKG